MSEPWDRPPFARRGSAQSVLYEAIGRTLMAWEEVEGALAHLYSAFATGVRFNTEANQKYGEPQNFVHRVETIKTIACRYFHKFPSQDTEGTFDELIHLALNWSNRRNDVAHGRARPRLRTHKVDSHDGCFVIQGLRRETTDGSRLFLVGRGAV
jgi:hypothetical protein